MLQAQREEVTSHTGKRLVEVVGESHRRLIGDVALVSLASSEHRLRCDLFSAQNFLDVGVEPMQNSAGNHWAILPSSDSK